MLAQDQEIEPRKTDSDNQISRQSPTGRLVLAIATTGRRGVLTQTLSRLHLQSLKPDLLILSIASEDDVDRSVLDALPCDWDIRTGEKGACFQRNQVVAQLQPNDILLFTDDDFLMANDYLEQVRDLFQENPQVVMATGNVIADGIGTSGISFEQGVELLNSTKPEAGAGRIEATYNGYGCNMAMRAAPIVQHQLRFDTHLPFYSWLEDVDFSRQLARYGTIVKSSHLTGVHLGTKLGRTSGKSLGYSQISNPIYLSRKGTMHFHRALRIMVRNVLANTAKSLRPEPWVDRRGRLYGSKRPLKEPLTPILAPNSMA